MNNTILKADSNILYQLLSMNAGTWFKVSTQFPELYEIIYVDPETQKVLWTTIDIDDTKCKIPGVIIYASVYEMEIEYLLNRDEETEPDVFEVSFSILTEAEYKPYEEYIKLLK